MTRDTMDLWIVGVLAAIAVGFLVLLSIGVHNAKHDCAVRCYALHLEVHDADLWRPCLCCAQLTVAPMEKP